MWTPCARRNTPSPHERRKLPSRSKTTIGCRPRLKAYTRSCASIPTAATSALNSRPGGSFAQSSTTSYRYAPEPRITGFATSASLEIVREVFLRRDPAAGQPQPVRLPGKRLDLRAVALEPVGMEILTHHGHGILELGLEPWSRVGEALLRRGEAIVGGDERLGQALGDPPVLLP